MIYCKFGQILMLVCLLGGLLCFHEIGAEGLRPSQGLKIHIQKENTKQLRGPIKIKNVPKNGKSLQFS